MGTDPLEKARAYLLCRNGAAVAFDPQPEILEELLLLLELHGAIPLAILETSPAAAADAASPAYALARARNWFWVGPVRAWETEGAVVRILDRLLLELHPAATGDDIARGRRLPHVDLDLAPFDVRVTPVEGAPGKVRYQLDGHDLPATDWLARGVELAGTR